MNEKNSPQLLVQVKAFHSLDENIKSLRLFLDTLKEKPANLFISVPYNQVQTFTETFKTNGIIVGVNEMVSATPSAFTGSIAGRMVGTSGSHFVLIPAFGANATEEAAAELSKDKIKAALDQNVIPYVTLNESWEEHHDGISKEAMSKRLVKTLSSFSEDQLQKIVIVYNAQWILGGLWESSSSDLKSAYKNVTDAVKEAFSGKIPPSRIIVSVPSYSTDLYSLVSSLNNQSDTFLGYFCGDLGPSTTQMQPLFHAGSDQITNVIPAQTSSKIDSKPLEPAEDNAKKKRPRAKSTEEN